VSQVEVLLWALWALASLGSLAGLAVALARIARRLSSIEDWAVVVHSTMVGFRSDLQQRWTVPPLGDAGLPPPRPGGGMGVNVEGA